MSTIMLYPDDEKLARGERVVFNLYLISALAVFVLMMLLGLYLRMAQGAWLNMSPNLFYEVMTAHGAGMVGAAGLGSIAVMWFFLRKYVRLSLPIFLANYVLFLLGALLILGATFLGHYGGAWTFLYPLPVQAMGLWTKNAAVLFMLGYVAIGVGFLLFYLDAMRAVIRRFGNLSRALGLPWLFGGQIDPEHPKTVVASTMVIIVNSIGTLVGAVVLVMSIINAYYPALEIDALLAKNLIYMFGHTFINATIYMAVIAVYELLPRYSGRPYPISRPFLWAWTASTVFVLTAYPHHLFMDYVMPHWALVVGQVISYFSGLPVFLVTAYGALTNIYRSGMRWSMPSRLLVLSMYGWAAGIVPAIIDGVISVNLVMHNTLWVPGHFHFYLMLGVLPMILALMYHVIGSRARSLAESTGDRLAFPVFAAGGLAFAVAFLAGGYAGAARRYAVHLPEWLPYDHWGSVAAMLVIVGTLLFTRRIIAGLLRASADARSAHPAG